MAAVTRSARLLLLHFICSAAEASTLHYGPTLVVRVDTKKGLAWVGVGARVAVVNTTTLRDRDMIGELNFLALSDPLTGGNVVALGLSSNGDSALASDASGNLTNVVLRIGGGAKSDGNQSVALLIQDLPPLLPSSFSATRISNALAVSSQDTYFIAANSKEEGQVLAIAGPSSLSSTISSSSSSSSSFQLIAGLAFNGSVNDAHVVGTGFGTSTLAVIATIDAGLANITFTSSSSSSLKLNGVMATATVGGNDGFALSQTGAIAAVAAQGNGLRVMNMNTGAENGSAAVDGWAGDVKLHSNGNDDGDDGDYTLALVAADPGLLAYEIDNSGADAVAAVAAKWACAFGGAGIGWNLDVDDAARLAYVADFDGGLQVVSYGSDAPRVVAHFGNGTMATCDDGGSGSGPR